MAIGDRASRRVVSGARLAGLVAVCIPGVASAQLRAALDPAAAIRLQPGDLMRYYKVRPAEVVDGLPYQVLIIVTTNACIVKTNKWELAERLTDAQKADLKETFGYQDPKDFRRPYEPPEEPIAPRDRLDFYLSFRRQGTTISWNSIKFGKPRLPSLFDFLEVCHYLALKVKEPER